METVSLQTRFEKIEIGSRVELYTPIAMYSGVLESVDDAGVVVSWRILEWQVVNGVSQETLMTKYQFIGYDSIVSYALIKT